MGSTHQWPSNKADVLDTAHDAQGSSIDTSLILDSSMQGHTHYRNPSGSSVSFFPWTLHISHPGPKKRGLDSYHVPMLWYEKALTVAILPVHVFGSDTSSSSQPNIACEVQTGPIETVADLKLLDSETGANEDN
jgi:hypothetical protein